MKKFLPSIAFIGLAALTAPSAFATVDGGITSFGDVYAEPGQLFDFYAQVTNKGTEEIKSLSYTVTINDFEGTQSYTIDLDAPLATGAKLYLKLKATAPDTNDISKTMKVKLTGINGEAVEKTAASGKLHTADFVPVLRSLVEDYTGAWCGYCPRGTVTLETIARDYPNKILTIAYHYSDAMDVSTMTEPVPPEGFPTLNLNRETANASGTLGGIALKKSNDLADAAVTMVSADWLDEDNYEAKGVVTIEFGQDVKAGDYAVDFFLVEDGLQSSATGNSSYWDQVSYYYGSSPAWTDPLWDKFVDNEEYHYQKTANGYIYDYINGLTYNDVCIANASASSSYNASIPTTSARTPITVEYTFNGVNNIKEYGSSKKYILQNPDQCRIAVVVTSNDGSFVNCDWMEVSGQQSGVKTVQADDSNVNAEKEYFNLSGMKIAADNLTPGIYIVRQGNKTSKVVIR